MARDCSGSAARSAMTACTAVLPQPLVCPVSAEIVVHVVGLAVPGGGGGRPLGSGEGVTIFRWVSPLVTPSY